MSRHPLSRRVRRKQIAVCLFVLHFGISYAPQAFSQSDSPTQLLSDWLTDHNQQVPSLLVDVGTKQPPIELDAIVNLSKQFASVDPRIAQLLDEFASASASGDFTAFESPPDWLEDIRLPTPAANVLHTFVAGNLHARGLYEESLSWLASVDTKQAIAPHLVLYYRATAAHQLVQLELADQSAEELLKLAPNLLRRHEQAAGLILRDTEGVEEDSLDHIGRRMADIRRRLALGRTAEPEQELQQEVLDALDKMIEDAEKQQQKQQQQQASGSKQPSSGKPAEQSRPSDLKGPGEVDPREVTRGGDWGSLPPKERESVTQQIGRDFPSHYRGLIKAYFRSLAQNPDGNAAPSADKQSREATPSP